MLNYLWGGMILLAILVAVFTGNMAALTNAALDSAREAVTLCITMLGILSMWTGLMTVAEKAGLITALSRRAKPTLRYLFPDLGREHEAHEPIATNFIANILGLGWAATPSGLKAMEIMQRENPEPDTATPSMRMFMVINMSSLQLVTISVVAYRLQYGSANPSEIIGPGLLITIITTIFAVAFCKFLEKIEQARTAAKRVMQARRR
ncbi:MAG: nucleoside recognition protein [Defluviitaleaceae bacterium]|nr:nucleoside recognition protein [Defluviitaleaceae bacterium]